MAEHILEDLHASFTHFNTSRHLLVPSLWVAGLRSRLGEDGLFVYYHMEAQSYVLAIWWTYNPVDGETPPSGEPFMELKVLGGNPDSEDLPNGDVEDEGLPSDALVVQLCRTWNEIYTAALDQQKREEEEAENRRQDGKRHRDDVVKYLKRTAGTHREDSPAITGIEDGSVPWTSPYSLSPQEKADFEKLIGGS